MMDSPGDDFSGGAASEPGGGPDIAGTDDRQLTVALLLGVITSVLSMREDAMREFMKYENIAFAHNDGGTVNGLRITMASGPYLLTIVPEEV